MSRKQWIGYIIVVSVLIGLIFSNSFQQTIEVSNEPTCGGYSYLLVCRADEGDFLLHDEHGYMCRQALKREEVCDDEIWRNNYWYKPMCDQYLEYLGNHTTKKGIYNV